MKIEKINQKDMSTIKTHDEILDLINEMKSIEYRIDDIEIKKVNPFENERLKQEYEQNIKSIKKTNETPSSKNLSKFKGNLQTEIRKGKKIKFPFSIKFQKNRKHLKHKNKQYLKTIKEKSDETIETHEFENQAKEAFEKIIPIKSTFTLTINDQGNLIGFNNIKPKSKKESKSNRSINFMRIFSSRSKDKKTEKSNIKEKIKGIFLKFKRK